MEIMSIMLLFKSLFLRCSNIYDFKFECLGFGSWKMSWRKTEQQPSLVVNTTTATATTTTTSSPPPWDSLPNDILAAIFQKLWIGDRARSRLVCKLWNQILTEDCNPKAPEAPWKILSDDSYKKRQSCLDEIRFKSLSEQRIYRFKLPLSICDESQSKGGWWCCGSSRGWLLVAVGANLNASLFLWQPLSGETRKLPPASTLPYFDEYIALGVVGMIDNLSSVIHKVEVFSVGLNECVVAVLFRRNACFEIALCTPHVKTWKVFGDGDFGVCYSDMLFHSTTKQLYALATRIPPEHQWENFLSNDDEVLLTESCRVPMSIIMTPLEDTNISQDDPFGRGLQVAHNHNQICHLIESSLTQRILVVSAWLDCVARENPWKEPVVRFRSQQTRQLTVYIFDPEKYATSSREKYQMEILRSIGEETIFLGDAGSFSMQTVDGICADCIYFATNDAEGLEINSDTRKYHALREHGVFSLRKRKMQRYSFTTLRFLSGSRVGWFMPQL